jgi:hypothetical protein
VSRGDPEDQLSPRPYDMPDPVQVETTCGVCHAASWQRLLHTSHTFRVYTPARSTELCSEVCAYVDYHNEMTDEYIRKLQHANGDTATVFRWTDVSVTVDWDVGVGESAQTVWAIDEFARYFQLAYAITIHKSQGSEYDAGVVVLSPKCRWFAQRSSLYTAITRFKSECAIFALDVDLDAAINAPMHLPIIGNMARRLQAAEARNADDGRHD